MAALLGDVEMLRGDDLAPGARAGSWVIEHELGRGGMGVVYAVVHEKIGKRAALKILHRWLLGPGSSAERMLLEGRVVNQVGHPNIVDIFESGVMQDGRPYIVMERLDGRSLADRPDGALDPRAAFVILLEVCDALIAAHAAGVVHRDLKPDNIFLVTRRDDPDQPRVKLVDWGIARLIHLDVRHTVQGQLVGTPQYLSPEQARGARVMAPSDIYSLGVVAFELFVGQPPFTADTTAQLLLEHLVAAPPLPRLLWPQIPRVLETLLLRMLAKAPEDRPTATEVAHELEVAREQRRARRPLSIEPEPSVARQPSVESHPSVARQPSVELEEWAVPDPRVEPGPSIEPERWAAPEAWAAPDPWVAPNVWDEPNECGDLDEWGELAPRRPRWPIAIGGLAIVAFAAMVLLASTVDAVGPTVRPAVPASSAIASEQVAHPSCAEPGVTTDGVRWYMTCTGSAIYESTDLWSWRAAGWIFPTGAQPAWAAGNLSAPELHHGPSGVIAYFTARAKGGTMAIGAATAASVRGPFSDLGAPLLAPRAGARDAHVTVTADGQRLLYYRLDDQPGSIWVQPLTADGLRADGARTRVLSATQPWEHGIVEAPWIERDGRYYYLFYSGARSCGASYAFSVARSTSPLGPFTKRSQPLARTGTEWAGPGHTSFARGPDGSLRAVYHAYRLTEGAPTCETNHADQPDRRRAVVSRVRFDGGWPVLR